MFLLFIKLLIPVKLTNYVTIFLFLMNYLPFPLNTPTPHIITYYIYLIMFLLFIKLLIPVKLTNYVPFFLKLFILLMTYLPFPLLKKPKKLITYFNHTL